jgi:hypothetical protein
LGRGTRVASGGGVARGAFRSLVLSLSLAGPGCLGTEAERDEQARRLDRCRDGASDQQVLDNILITEEYASAVAADLAWSWMPVLFALDFMILWSQTLQGISGESPASWSHEDGTYRYGSTAAAIEMRVLHGPDAAPVTEDILSLDSYLLGAAVEYDEESDTATITWDSPGPLVELLGYGETPQSPLVLGAAEREAVVANLATLAVEPEFIAYGVQPGSSTIVAYHVKAPAHTIAAIAAGEVTIHLELVAVNATRESLGQTLTTESWQVRRDGPHVTGYTTFTVSGGHFPYRGRIDFIDVPATVLAERTLECQ